MTEEAKEARRAYKRTWARNHPDKIRQQQLRYWQKVAEREAERENGYKNPDSEEKNSEIKN